MVQKMKRIFFLIFIINISLDLFPADTNLLTANGIDFSAGLLTSYSSTPIVFKDTETETRLNTIILALEVDFDITDFLAIGVIAGYNWSRHGDALDITGLPLSLQIEESVNKSMIFGLNLKSEFFSRGDISFSARGEFLYFKLFKQENDIILPVVTGLATLKHWFFNAGFDLLFKYHGFDALVLFLGPQINISGGTLTASESIEELTGEYQLNHHQKNLFGLVGGLTYEFGRDWLVVLELNLLSQYSINAGIFYQF